MSMVGTVFLKLSDFSMACENIHSHICVLASTIVLA